MIRVQKHKMSMIKISHKTSEQWKPSILADASVLREDIKKNESIKLSVEKSIENASKQRGVLETILYKIYDNMTSRLERHQSDIDQLRLANLSTRSF